MPIPSDAEGTPDGTDTVSWPWACIDCGATIYHDGECCRACRRGRRRAARRSGPDGFGDWVHRQSVPGLSLKVSLIAGVELSLTALWLRLLLAGPSALGGTVPGLF